MMSRDSPKGLGRTNRQNDVFDLNKPIQSTHTKDSMRLNLRNDDDRPIRSPYASHMSNRREPTIEPFSSLNDRANLRLKI